MNAVKDRKLISNASKEQMEQHIHSSIFNKIKKYSGYDILNAKRVDITTIEYVPGIKKIIKLVNEVFNQNMQLKDHVTFKIECCFETEDDIDLVYQESNIDNFRKEKKILLLKNYEIKKEIIL